MSKCSSCTDAKNKNHLSSTNSKKSKESDSCGHTTSKVIAVVGGLIVFAGLLALLAISLQQAGALTSFFNRVSEITTTGASSMGTTAVALSGIIVGFGGLLLLTGLTVIITKKCQEMRARQGLETAAEIQSESSHDLFGPRHRAAAGSS